ncbi:hypothetical protein G3I76_47935, partial [Streptomyces sp. SID11233]|nr:hypothetical protein [Streptomyces sp. SID11233]
NAGYDVAADLAYEPTPPAARAADRAATPSPVPTVAFAEHPQLGFIAATDDQLDSERAGRVLHERGWLHQETLDIYVLPQPDGRGPAL